jgi:hypothetical protein
MLPKTYVFGAGNSTVVSWRHAAANPTLSTMGSWYPISIRRIVGMTLWAMSLLLLPVATFFSFVLVIIGVGTKKKMFWIYATTNIALVQNIHAFGNWSDKCFKAYPMGSFHFFLYMQDPISIFSGCVLPNPASVIKFVNFESIKSEINKIEHGINPPFVLAIIP